MLGILISTTIIIVGCCGYYKYQLSPVSSSKKVVDVEIPNNTSVRGIASILKEKGLIRDQRMFLVYVKLLKKDNLKSGYYDFSYNMGVEKIVALLEEGSKKNPNEIQITFKEGITMRDIATVISFDFSITES